jgi:hypothetical protein
MHAIGRVLDTKKIRDYARVWLIERSGPEKRFLTDQLVCNIVSILEPAGNAIVRWIDGDLLSAITAPRSVTTLLVCFKISEG